MAIANFSEFFSLKLISTRSNAVIPRASTTSFASGVKSTPKIVKTDTTMVAQDDNSFIPKFLSSMISYLLSFICAAIPDPGHRHQGGSGLMRSRIGILSSV